MGQGYSPGIGATNRRLTKSNPAFRATLTRARGETSSIVRWSAPTSGATVIPSLLSRHEDRFHGPALPNRLESLGGLLERILREQGTRVYITASQQVQGRLVVCVVARVAK